MTDDGSAGRQIGGPVIPDLSVDDDPINGRTRPSHYRDQTKSGHFCLIPDGTDRSCRGTGAKPPKTTRYSAYIW